MIAVLVNTVPPDSGQHVGVAIVDTASVDPGVVHGHKVGLGGRAIDSAGRLARGAFDQVAELGQHAAHHALGHNVGGAVGAVAVATVPRAVHGDQVAAVRGIDPSGCRVVQPVKTRDIVDPVGDKVEHAAGEVGQAVGVHVAVADGVVFRVGQVVDVGLGHGLFVTEVIVVVQVHVNRVIDAGSVGVTDQHGHLFAPDIVAQALVYVGAHVDDAALGHGVRDDVGVIIAQRAIIDPRGVGEAGETDPARAQRRGFAGVNVGHAAKALGHIGRRAKVQLVKVGPHGKGVHGHGPAVVLGGHGAGVDLLGAHQVGVAHVYAVIYDGHGHALAHVAPGPGGLSLVWAFRQHLEPVLGGRTISPVAKGLGLAPGDILPA